MNIIKRVLETPRDRSPESFAQRLLKLSEECGEVAQAYLGVAQSNKGKTWQDVRLELVDVLAVDLDLLCGAFPDRGDLTADQQIKAIEQLLDRKLRRWAKKASGGAQDIRGEQKQDSVGSCDHLEPLNLMSALSTYYEDDQ